MAELRNLEDELAEGLYVDKSESWEVDLGHKLFQIFDCTVKVEDGEGGKDDALRRWACLTWGVRRWRIKVDIELLELDQGGQADKLEARASGEK